MRFTCETLITLSIFTVLAKSSAFNPNRSGITYPGTKWCGPGHNANSINDIGSDHELDSCCREHDLCPDKMMRFTSKHGLRNNNPYSLSHCECDERLYSCLKNIDTTTSNLIGTTFFTIIRTKCYKLEHPATCVSRSFWRRRCLMYEYDSS